jgi:hypothetical protein
MPRSLFLNSNGKSVVALPDPHFGPNAIGLITFTELTDTSAAIVITSMSDKVNPRYQVTDTLGERTILNTFGRSMDTRLLEGVCYEAFCAPERNQDESGFEKLMQFFDSNHAGARNTPVIITIGKAFTRNCYLLEMEVTLADSTARVWQFSAKLIVEPERDQNDLRRQAVQPRNVPVNPVPQPVQPQQEQPLQFFQTPQEANNIIYLSRAFNSKDFTTWNRQPTVSPATQSSSNFSGDTFSAASGLTVRTTTTSNVTQSGDPVSLSNNVISRTNRATSGLNPFVVA